MPASSGIIAKGRLEICPASADRTVPAVETGTQQCMPSVRSWAIIISMVRTMRQVTIAIVALLISPLPPAAQAQQSGAAARDRAVEAILYHQVVHDDGISLGLVTDPQGVDFRQYLTQILSKLKPRWGQTWRCRPETAIPSVWLLRAPSRATVPLSEARLQISVAQVGPEGRWA